MPFGATSLSRLSGAKPELVAALSALEADFYAQGGDLTVRDYGGFRTYETQALLVEWRDQAVSSGQPFYAVAPAGTSAHETGNAGDVKVTRNPPGWTDGQSYRWLADRAPAQGLVAGYYFGGGPPSAKSDPFHFELGTVFPGVPDIRTLPDDTGGNDVPPWRMDEAGNFPSEASGEPSGMTSLAAIGAVAVLGILGFLWWRSH